MEFQQTPDCRNRKALGFTQYSPGLKERQLHAAPSLPRKTP
jgi:hypothetical protein